MNAPKNKIPRPRFKILNVLSMALYNKILYTKDVPRGGGGGGAGGSCLPTNNITYKDYFVKYRYDYMCLFIKRFPLDIDQGTALYTSD